MGSELMSSACVWAERASSWPGSRPVAEGARQVWGKERIEQDGVEHEARACAPPPLPPILRIPLLRSFPPLATPFTSTPGRNLSQKSR